MRITFALMSVRIVVATPFLIVGKVLYWFAGLIIPIHKFSSFVMMPESKNACEVDENDAGMTCCFLNEFHCTWHDKELTHDDNGLPQKCSECLAEGKTHA